MLFCAENDSKLVKTSFSNIFEKSETAGYRSIVTWLRFAFCLQIYRQVLLFRALAVIQRLYRSAKYGAITCLLIFKDETGRSYVSLDFEGLSKLICKTSSGKTGLRKKECMTEEPEIGEPGLRVV